VVVAGVCAPGSAAADDLKPPSWRGQAGSTVQHWGFAAGSGGGAPDALPLNNPYGTPNLMVIPGGATWHPVTPFGLPPRPDVWMLVNPALMLFDVPNEFNNFEQKLIRVQVTFLDVIPEVDVGPSPNGLPQFTVVQTGFSTTPLSDGWTHGVWDFALNICPGAEIISVAAPQGATCFVDQVVIDTICVPGPSGLAMMGVVMLGRRRRGV
jgi:hypothetical protein